jgi:hypothetical protein
MKTIIKPAFVLLLLHCTFTAPAQLQDTVYIFDYSSSKNIVRKTGREPLLLRFSNGDTLLLDANSSRGKKAGDAIFGNYTIPAGRCRVEGVRIIFDKSTTCCIRATGSDGFRDERFRKMVFYLDTILCISSSTTRPLMFWNVLRQKFNNDLSFLPILFNLSNVEFTIKKRRHNKRMRRFFAAVSHEYNSVTGRLTLLSPP